MGRRELAYRGDIDGIRAVAVAAVILYHGYPSALGGGFVGVDVFFVISGFLISGNILRRIEAGDFGFFDFYRRRVLRIFPALLVVLPCVLLYGALVLLPNEFARLGADAAAGAAFVSNLLLWHEAGYFDRAAIAKPLLHLWSLGVEEQFYIVWPLALWLLARRRGALIGGLALAWLASFVLSTALAGADRVADFYNPATRLWELDTGAILAALAPAANGVPALAWLGGRIGRWRRSDAASVLGLLMILGAALLFARHTPYPGWRALLPVSGTALLIAAGPDAFANRALLGRRAFVFVGLISYPLYLWHWPLISYGTILANGREPKPLVVLGMILASGGLAWLTYRFVERPFRFGANRRRAGLAAAGLMGLIAVASLGVWQARGFPGRFPPLPKISVARINAAIGERGFQATPGMRERKIGGLVVARLGGGGDPVLFVGDSTIFQYAPRVQALLDTGRLTRTVFFAAGASCAPVPGMARTDAYRFCNALPSVASRLIAARRIRTVIIGASWGGYLGGPIGIVRHGVQLRLDTPRGAAAFYANLADELRRLIASGHQVYLVAAPVADLRFDPHRMVERSLAGVRVDPHVLDGVPVRVLAAGSAPIDERLRQVAAATGARLLDPLRDVCGPGPVCSAFFGDGDPKYIDGLHLRAGFVARRVTLFDAILTRPIRAGATPAASAAPPRR
ncbi:MAG: acyltransferase [Rhodospirillales bacterium]|nr:acyltransferase [Rhodospirillales bacterium]